MTEPDPAGSDFLAQVCVRWEAATAAGRGGRRPGRPPAHRPGARPRGLLVPVLPLFRLGLGGRLGSGRQWWPWITLADEVGAIRHLLTADVSGPVNLTGPSR